MTELYVKIGKLLQMERVRQAIELGDLASDLKVSQANIEAIEDGDIDRLPSELYFKLFAKSYAEALGIDYEATVEAIEQDMISSEQPAATRADDSVTESVSGEAAGEPAESATSNGSRRQVSRLVYLLAAVVVLFVIVVAVNELVLKESETESAVDSTEAADVEPSTITPSESDELAGYDWNVPAYAEPAALTLVLVARTESWATVLADGDTAVYRTLTPGRRYEVTAKYRMKVSVGVPSAVSIELNGQPVNLRNPESGRIAGIEIDQINLDQFLARPLTTSRSTGRPSVNATPSSLTNQTTSASEDTTGATMATEEVSSSDDEPQDSI
jgi:hypothetical protein